MESSRFWCDSEQPSTQQGINPEPKTPASTKNVLCLFDFTDVSSRELSEYTSSISEFAKAKPDIRFPVLKKKLKKKN